MSRRKNPDVVAFYVRMSPELHDAVKVRAALEDRSMAQVVRVALRAYLKRNPA